MKMNSITFTKFSISCRLKEAAKKAKLAAKGKNMDMKVKCGACGSHGHMKTNRACPKFNPNDPENQLGNINVALTEQGKQKFLSFSRNFLY